MWATLRATRSPARVAGIPFIFAKYGFGEPKAPDYVLEEFAKLPAPAQQIEQL